MLYYVQYDVKNFSASEKTLTLHSYWSLASASDICFTLVTSKFFLFFEYIVHWIHPSAQKQPLILWTKSSCSLEGTAGLCPLVPSWHTPYFLLWCDKWLAELAAQRNTCLVNEQTIQFANSKENLCHEWVLFWMFTRFNPAGFIHVTILFVWK